MFIPSSYEKVLTGGKCQFSLAFLANFSPDVWIRCNSLMLGQLKITQQLTNGENIIKIYEEGKLKQFLTNGAVDVDVEKYVKCIIAEVTFEFNHNHYSES